MTRSLVALILALGLLACPVIAGCGDSNRTTVTVFAASSLADAFAEVAAAFEADHPEVHVRLSFASSAALIAQVQEGADPDILASADPALLAPLRDRGSVEQPVPFASNSLVIAVASGDDSVQQLSDLARPGLRLVLAAPGVPLGDYSREVLARAAAGGPGGDFEDAVLANVRSEEANARATLAKIVLGEADAGIVYATDIGAAGDGVRTVTIPPEYNVATTYASATVTGTGQAELIAEFQAFLTSDDGRAILASWGFGPPEASPS